MNTGEKDPAFGNTVLRLLPVFLCTTLIVQSAKAERQYSQANSKASSSSRFLYMPLTASGAGSASDAAIAVPSGTMLPVRLNSTISSAKCKPGQVITGRVMQDVPLSSGVRIREGSKVIGHIVEVTPASTAAQARISLQFDKLIASNQTFSITTNLRAIAGFMRIIEAQTPPIGPGESDVYRWLTTVQVGGDVVYGEGGPVTTGENPNEVVGKAVAGGVLSRVRAKEGTKCRGAIGGNDSPQALWVFSSGACGTYGLEHITIVHAGRTDPIGVIILASDSGNLKILGGAGMLLRVSTNTAKEVKVEISH
jgi:hypothetical protein